jgi:hypothetical protein
MQIEESQSTLDKPDILSLFSPNLCHIKYSVPTSQKTKPVCIIMTSSLVVITAKILIFHNYHRKHIHIL